MPSARITNFYYIVHIMKETCFFAGNVLMIDTDKPTTEHFAGNMYEVIMSSVTQIPLATII